MTIKTECVVKHLKHDYKEIATVAGIITVVIAIGILSLMLFQYSYAMAHTIAFAVTAYNIFMTITISTAAVVTIVLAIFGTPKTFKYTAPKEGTAPHENITEECTSSIWMFITTGLAVVWMFYGMYNFDGWIKSIAYPDVFITTILISIYIVVVTPICGAIARCKE